MKRCVMGSHYALAQWFSTFLMLKHNTVPDVVTHAKIAFAAIS